MLFEFHVQYYYYENFDIDTTIESDGVEKQVRLVQDDEWIE